MISFAVRLILGVKIALNWQIYHSKIGKEKMTVKNWFFTGKIWLFILFYEQPCLQFASLFAFVPEIL